MRNCFPAPIVFLGITLCCGTPASATVRTIENTPSLPSGALRLLLTPTFYQKVAAAPIESWIVARGLLAGTRLAGAKVTKSEANAAYDSLALQIANATKVPENFSFTTESRITSHPVRLDLLIYNIDGRKLAVCLVHLEDRNAETASLYVIKNQMCTRVLPGEDGVRGR